MIISNPFVLDFFGLARGYGLACGFILPAIYFLLRFLHKPDTRYVIYTLGFCVMAVLSSLPSLNFFLGVLAALAVGSLAKRLSFFRIFTYLILVALSFYALYALLNQQISTLLSQDNLYYGGSMNFYRDTLISLTGFSMDSPFRLHLMHRYLNAFLLLAGPILVMSVVFFRKKLPIRKPGSITHFNPSNSF